MIRYLLVLLALAVTSSQSQKVPVGLIEFFGTEGMDVEKARSVLPVHQGDEIPRDQSPVFYLHPELEKEIRGALKNALGQEPTDVQIFCCSKRWGYSIFIGLEARTATLQPSQPPRETPAFPRRRCASLTML